MHLSLERKISLLMIVAFIFSSSAITYLGVTGFNSFSITRNIADERAGEVALINELALAKEFLLKTSMTLRDILLAENYDKRLHWEEKRSEYVVKLNQSLELLRASTNKDAQDTAKKADKALKDIFELVGKFDAIWKNKENSNENIIKDGNAIIQGELVPARNIVLDSFAELIKIEADNAAKEKLLLQSNYESAKVNTIFLISSVLIIGFALFLVSMFVIRNATKRLTTAKNTVLKDSENVSRASQEFSRTSQSIALSSQESAAALEEISASITQLSGLVSRNSQSASTTRDISIENSKITEAGQESMNKLVKVMDQISNSSEKIHATIRIIDDIAFQTNLLALNAAVEAARAGDAGKGFAVVADEVRNLAQRSAQAAKEITQLISVSASKINEGSNGVKATSNLLNDVLNQASKVKHLVEEIATGAKEQSYGIIQIEAALKEINKNTQMNAAASEECAANGEELSSYADSLDVIVSELGNIIEGKKQEAHKQTTKSSKSSKRVREDQEYYIEH